MTYVQTVYDWDDKEVVPGSRVHYYDQPLTPENVGIVVEVTDWEGDVDDEGRSISIAPRVYVRFGDGELDWFSTSEWEHDFDYVPDEDPIEVGCRSSGRVEELYVIRDYSRSRG